MSNFAVIENGIIKNLIICDSKEIAEELTGLDCIQYDTTEISPECGWEVVDGEIINPNPQIAQEEVVYTEEDFAAGKFIVSEPPAYNASDLNDPNNPNNPIHLNR
jgi:hypothetical protein